MESGSNFGIIKEPRGFLKIIQIFFAILAFATTCGFSSSLKFQANCPSPVGVKAFGFSFSYPFKLSSDNSIPKNVCSSTDEKFIPFGDFTAPSQFYVFVGVMAFLYCLAALILYIFFSSVYSTNPWGPKSDLIITIVFAVFWFIAAVAWADGVSKLKYYTTTNRFFFELTECNPELHKDVCQSVFEAGYAGLDISLICGFTNVGLWGACVWFIWKECPWYGRGENFTGNADGVEGGSSYGPDSSMPGATTGGGPIDNRY